MTNYIEYTFECQKCGKRFDTKKIDLADTKARYQAKKDFHECPKCKSIERKKTSITDQVINYNKPIGYDEAKQKWLIDRANGKTVGNFKFRTIKGKKVRIK